MKAEPDRKGLRLHSPAWGEDGALMVANAGCRRKRSLYSQRYCSGTGISGKTNRKELLFRSLSEMRGLGASEVYITAKAPLFSRSMGSVIWMENRCRMSLVVFSCGRYGKRLLSEVYEIDDGNRIGNRTLKIEETCRTGQITV